MNKLENAEAEQRNIHPLLFLFRQKIITTSIKKNEIEQVITTFRKVWLRSITNHIPPLLRNSSAKLPPGSTVSGELLQRGLLFWEE